MPVVGREELVGVGARALVLEEREVISRELARGRNPRFIARVLGRHHSSVYEEVRNNGGPEEYRAVDAQARADRLRSRPRERKLVSSEKLHDAVNDGFEKQWSPEQIPPSAAPWEVPPVKEWFRTIRRRRRCGYRTRRSTRR